MLSFFQNNPNTSVFDYSKHSLFSLDNNSFKDQQTSTNFNEIPFSSISSIPNEQELYIKRKRSKKPTKGPWTEEEDRKLLKWIETVGSYNWKICSKIIPGRTGKQCRERWVNGLNPKIKRGEWTREEDLLIYLMYKTIGGKWSKICLVLRNRTENSVKNRFYTNLRRIYLDKIKKSGNKIKKYEDKPTRVGTNVLLNYLPDALSEIKEEIQKEKGYNDNEYELYTKSLVASRTNEIKVNIFNNKKSILFKTSKKSKNKKTNNIRYHYVNDNLNFKEPHSHSESTISDTNSINDDLEKIEQQISKIYGYDPSKNDLLLSSAISSNSNAFNPMISTQDDLCEIEEHFTKIYNCHFSQD